MLYPIMVLMANSKEGKKPFSIIFPDKSK